MPSIADRVRETTTTTGTGTVNLEGAVTGFQLFSSAFSTGTEVYYCISDGTNWEIGYGAATTGSPWTLARSTVLQSSNADALVDFGAGIKDVFCTMPAQAFIAANIANTPAGNIAATTVQAAINELDNEKAGLALANTFTEPQTIVGSGGTVATFGPELVTNGTFTGAATGWTLGADWAYGTDNVILTNDGSSGTLSQNITVESGKSYYVTWSQTNSIADNAQITPSIGGVSGTKAINPSSVAAATQTQIITAGATGSLAFTVTDLTTTGTVTIDTVSVKEITAYAATTTIKGASGDTTPTEIRGTTSLNNTFMGFGAGSRNTTGVQNAASGVQALYSNTTGVGNTASGGYALYSNTTGNYNTASGVQALYSNTTGVGNTASGRQALYSNTTGVGNTASGRQALYSNTTGNYNTASGGYALLSNTTGVGNTASGLNALYSNTTGSNNTASGGYALLSNTTGVGNTASGLSAGRYAGSGTTANTVSNSSIYLGYQTRASADGNTNEVVIGYDALGSGSNTVTLGNTATTTQVLRGSTLRLTTAKTPTSATAAGTAGDICWDASYIYVCVATNTWKRTAITTW